MEGYVDNVGLSETGVLRQCSSQLHNGAFATPICRHSGLFPWECGKSCSFHKLLLSLESKTGYPVVNNKLMGNFMQ
jgi:hypothetical protein